MHEKGGNLSRSEMPGTGSVGTVVITSVSTIPGRIEGFLRVLASIERQSQRPDLLLITLSRYYPRTGKHFSDEERDRLARFLDGFPIATIILDRNEDIGPVVKLVAVIDYMHANSLLKDQQKYLVFIFDDDNIVYSRAIELLVGNYQRYRQLAPQAVYGLMGIIESTPDHPLQYMHGEYIADRDFVPVDVLGGYRGVLYPAQALFDSRSDADSNLSHIITMSDWIKPFLEAHEKEKMIAMHDDHIFAHYCMYRGIPRRVIRLDGAPEGQLYFNPIPNSNGVFNDAMCERSYQLMLQTLQQVYGVLPMGNNDISVK